MLPIPVHVQYRHAHLSEKDAAALFGRTLTVLAEIGHRGQHVCAETVDVVSPAGAVIERVRVLGPAREATQVELAPSDAAALGLNAPVRVSGDVVRSGRCTLVGPAGRVELSSGVIIPARHLHCNDRDAARLGVSHHQVVSLAPEDRPSDAIDLVTVRVHPTFALALHLTTDEASEHWLQTGDRVTLL